MTSIGLLLHAEYYCKHILVFLPYMTLITMTGTHLNHCQVWFHFVCVYPNRSYTDTNMPFDELVSAEAIFNCEVKKWCGFLCLLMKCFYTTLTLILMLPDRVIVIQPKN